MKQRPLARFERRVGPEAHVAASRRDKLSLTVLASAAGVPGQLALPQRLRDEENYVRSGQPYQGCTGAVRSARRRLGTARAFIASRAGSMTRSRRRTPAAGGSALRPPNVIGAPNVPRRNRFSFAISPQIRNEIKLPVKFRLAADLIPGMQPQRAASFGVLSFAVLVAPA